MKKTLKAAVLGGGEFGVALAHVAAQNIVEVKLWARDGLVCKHINEFHRHPHKLLEIALADNIEATTDLALALKNADFVILALPMTALQEVLQKISTLVEKKAIIISTSKGIVEKTLALPCDLVDQFLPKAIAKKSCFLSGPSFAIEMVKGLPTALTLASRDQEAAILFQETFSTPYFRLYRQKDIIGVCVGGAMKNVVAIAAGGAFALGLGRNALASLVTRGLLEITQLTVAMGGKPDTLAGPCGVGDLFLSCTDTMSRNYRLGVMLAQGKILDAALSSIGSVVEGANTAKAIPGLIETYQVDLPIILAVHEVLYQGLLPKQALANVLSRKPQEEGAYA